jgi:hypothetical protein
MSAKSIPVFIKRRLKVILGFASGFFLKNSAEHRFAEYLMATKNKCSTARYLPVMKLPT